MPRFLAHLHPGTQVPARAVLCYVAIAIALALSGSFLTLIVASALNSAAIYILACAAAFVLFRRRVVLAGPVPHVRVLPAIAAVGIASMVAVVAAAEWAEIMGLLATIAVAAILYAFTTRSSPA
jgi:amino acid transporter